MPSLRAPVNILFMLLAVTSLLACEQETDDDDSAICEACQMGSECEIGQCSSGCCIEVDGVSPVVDSVALCEVPDSSQTCQDQGGSPGSFQVEFGLSISDVDGDLNNPQYLLTVDLPPAMSGWIEQDMGEGGLLRVRVCGDWVRGAPLDYTVRVLDAAHNQSERVSGTWTIPSQPGDNDCDPQPAG